MLGCRVRSIVALLGGVSACGFSAPPYTATGTHPTNGVESGAGGESSSADTKPPGRAGPKAAPSDGQDPEPADGQDPAAGSANPPASASTCTGASIAAYADKLVKAARQSCTSSGVGVVDKDNFTCILAPIAQLNPANKDASFSVVKTLLANNVEFPLYECTYFVQTVTAAACGKPLSPDGTPWTNYPLAHEFAGKTAAGYTWIANDGRTAVRPGDIFVYGTSSTGENDVDHIMIVAAIVDSDHFRIAEANELNPDGSPGAGQETGVVSNTRIATLQDQDLTGWFRVNGS
jgi:hypothetical protein